MTSDGLLATALALSVASPVAAQTENGSSPTCFAPLTADIMLGTYATAVSPLEMTIGSRTMIMAPAETGTATITHTDLLDYLVTGVSPDIPDFILYEMDELEADWNWGDGPRRMGAIPQLDEQPIRHRVERAPALAAAIPTDELRDFRQWLLDRYSPEVAAIPSPGATVAIPGLGTAQNGLGLSSDDLRAIIGCDINEVPRLRGSFQTRSAEGVPVDFTVKVSLIGEGILFGQLSFISNPSQGPVTAKRTIIMLRQDSGGKR
ncbi:MAG: hypothetical protein JJ992_29515 [Planctomycetes bacterium]|nr:hypothetical protein [Planctomycetota bacterium]